VILVHGWGACAYTFRLLIPVLTAANRRVIAVDLRGHGLSDKPAGERSYSCPALLSDLRALLDVLGVSDATLVAHSLGGALALRFALEHPERVRRLVLAAPVGLTPIPYRHVASAMTPRITDRFARFLVPRWIVGMLLRAAYGDPRRVRESDVDEYWAPSEDPNYYRAVRALLRDFDWRPLSPAERGRMQARSLVILGTADRLLPDARREACELAASTVTIVKGGGHLAIEERPAEVNAAVAAFLDETDSA
jgi:pimeloyl-ACP methyl ester carboxylesterase